MLRKIFANYKFRAIFFFSLGLLAILSIASYNPSDPSLNLASSNSASNLLNLPGSYFADLMLQTFGIASIALPVCLISWSIITLRNQSVSLIWLRLFCAIILTITCAIALSQLTLRILPADAGGAFGKVLFSHILSLQIDYVENDNLILAASGISALTAFFVLAIKLESYQAFFAAIIRIILLPFTKLGIGQKILDKLNNLDSGEAYYAGEEFNQFEHQPNSQKTGAQPQTPPREDMTPLMPTIPKRKAPATRPTAQPAPLTADGESMLPSLDLLDEDHKQDVKPMSKAELDETAEQLLKVLADFSIKGKILNVRQGPVVTLYEFEPAAGTKSSRIIGLSDDIARSLSAVSTRIAVIPGRNALGIEIPNKKRVFFRLRELLETPAFSNKTQLLPLVLGKDLGGDSCVADLAKMPHLLVAGTTGSGKSVAINAMIMSLLYRYPPEECKMIMIDPKMLELSAYDNIPHLLTPVVTEPGKAVVALKWAVKEMENRYRLMSNLGVRNIGNYNSKIQEAKAAGKVLERRIQTGFDPETGKPIHEIVPLEMENMPFIVIIVDEMADLMLVAGKDIESSIQRLAQMARAAGIHIIMATQRPSVDVITGVIKANFPSRISFRVTSKIDSRTILGEQGSESLLGMGDMLYMGNSSGILRVHGPFVDDNEVERVTSFLRSTGTPNYVSAVTENADDEDFEASDGAETGSDDDIYNQAINIVKTERKSSISYIQRRLRIGYNKAANLVEEMERNGVLSAPNHSGKREILLPEE